MGEIGWSGMVAPYNQPTGDSARMKRMFRPGTIANRQTPFALYWQPRTGGGHEGAVIVGRVDYVDVDDPEGIWAAGVLFDPEKVPEAAQARFLLDEKVVGPSVDLDDTDFEVFDQMTGLPVHPDCGQFDTCPTHQVLVPSRARVSGVTLVGMTAFAEMGHSLEMWDTSVDYDDDFCGDCEEGYVSAVNTDFSTLPFAPRSREWNASAAAQRVEAFCKVDGEMDWDRYASAFLVAEGGPADDLGTYRFPVADVVNGRLAVVPEGVRAAANKLGGSGLKPERLEAARETLEGLFATMADLFEDDEYEAPWNSAPAALLASMGSSIFTDVPPKPYEAFNLKATEPTPVMILDSGQFWGHLALWDIPHRGYAEHGKEFFCPRSRKRYQEFLVGATRTTQGIIPTGKLVLGGGHADGALSIQRARRWYDENGAGMAEVNIVEDEFGPFMCGWLLPGVDALAADEIFRSPPSGDWRWDKTVQNYELVGVIGVNVPAFPVPRVRVVNGHAFSVMGAGIPWDLYGSGAEPVAAPQPHLEEFNLLTADLRAAELKALLGGMKV